MISELKTKFKRGELSKPEYILQMFEEHQLLFRYVDFLKETEVTAIEIVAGEGIIFTTKPNGIKLFCSKADKRTAPFEILNFDEYEKGDSEMIFRLLNDGDTIIDIGANIGWYSMTAAHLFKSSKIIAFEPVPDTFAGLRKNLELNQHPNIEIYNLGLGDRDGELTFFVSGSTSVSSSSANITNDTGAKEIVCKVTTLDKFVSEKTISKIDFIKCDVEGAELFVFKGAQSVIKEHLPVVFSEMLRKWSAVFNYHPNDIINLFRSLGYACFYNNEGKLMKVDMIDEQTLATNFYFLHTEKHQDIILRLTA